MRADGSPSGSLTRRAEGAIAYARTVANPKFIATGAVGRYGRAEAVVIRDLLMRDGIPKHDILLEDQARSTLDSVEFCDAILVRCTDVEAVVPCTSPYHIPRCALLFRLLGYKIQIASMPGDLPDLPLTKWLSYVIKEFAALPFDVLLLLLRHGVRRTVKRHP